MEEGQQNKWPIELHGDSIDELKRNPPVRPFQAYSQLVWCIRYSSINCVRWLLKEYPTIADMGSWCNSKPLEHCVCTWLAERGKLMPDMVLALLEAGAEPEPRFGKGQAIGLLFNRREQFDAAYVDATAHHLINYGSWVSPTNIETEHLLPYYEARLTGLSARLAARRALWVALRRKGAPKDVVRLVVGSAPLSERLSWKEWAA